MTDEELKHQELFRRLEAMMAADMPAGYVPTADPNAVARRRARQEHLGRAGADAATSSCSRRRTTAPASRPRTTCRELWKDVFLFHWKEESQHAILDELELLREDAQLDAAAARRRGRRPDRAGRRGRRHPAGAGRGRCALLLRHRGHGDYADAQREQIDGDGAEGLPLAVHRLGRDGAALPEGAVRAASTRRRPRASRTRWRR